MKRFLISIIAAAVFAAALFPLTAGNPLFSVKAADDYVLLGDMTPEKLVTPDDGP